MRNLVFVCTYRGSAAPHNEAGTELKANTSGTRVIPLDGSELPAGIGSSPTFESIVTIGEEGRFGEQGSIDLGGGNTIRFREVSPGTMLPGPTGGSVGAIDWNIESGTGVFEGASGFITSNFSVGEDGTVVDHQLTSVHLP
jgi:hypothetical protein